MQWLNKLFRKETDKKLGDDDIEGNNLDQREDPEMEKHFNAFVQTCWPRDYGHHTLGVDTRALQKLQGPYLDRAKAAILKSLKTFPPEINVIIAASSIDMVEAVPIFRQTIEEIRSTEDKSQLYVSYSRIAAELYRLTKDEIYLTDVVEAIRVSGFADPSGADVIHSLGSFPVTTETLSAVWNKLKQGKVFKEFSFWRQACEDYLRTNIDQPTGKIFLHALPETEQREIQSFLTETNQQRIERNRRIEKFVIGHERYDKDDLNVYGEYIKTGGSPIPGLALRCILAGHEKGINCISWAPTRASLTSAANDNTIRIWDADTGTCIAVVEGGEIDRSGLKGGYESDYRISTVTWSPDGALIAFGSAKKGISVWSHEQKEFVISPRREGESIEGLTWAPDGNFLGYLQNNCIWIKDVFSAKDRQIFNGLSGRFESLAWSPTGDLIAAGYWDHEKRKDRLDVHEILIWDVKTDKIISRIGHHSGYITQISWMSHQPILAVSCSDNTVSIWNAQDNQQIASLESHSSRVNSVAFSAGDALLASTAERDGMIGGTTRLWRTDTWEELMILKEVNSSGHALAFHKTLPLFSTLSHGNPEQRSGSTTASFIRVWDLDIDRFLKNPPFMARFDETERSIIKTQEIDREV